MHVFNQMRRVFYENLVLPGIQSDFFQENKKCSFEPGENKKRPFDAPAKRILFMIHFFLLIVIRNGSNITTARIAMN